jgi:fibronectin-binding autotransporter adhesin
MKAEPIIFTRILALCSALVATAAFGQTTFVWTNQLSPVDIAGPTNWSPNGTPNATTGPDLNGSYGDEMQWDGQTTNDVAMFSNTGLQTFFSGQAWGLTYHLTSNQSRSVQLYTTLATSLGIRSKQFILDSGAGSFHLGDNTLNALDVLMGGTNPQTHGFTNNSANAATIYPNVRWRMGGGGAHTYVFEGTGDWIVNNRLRSQNGAAILVFKSGSGTMTWTATNVPNSFGGDALGTPVRVDGGTLVIKSSDCIANQAIAINALFKYDAPVGQASPAGTVSGTGVVQVASGTLALSSGNSTFSGNINLTGGELIAGGLENPGVSGPLGVGSTISFAGGTLGFSVNNVFDYSSRFNTNAGQAYSIDTAGQTVTFTNSAVGLTSSGGTLTKLGNGTLTLAGGTNTYDGLTAVSLGKLVFQSPKTGAGNITVADGAALGVFATGTQVTPSTLTLGTSSSATLEFNNVNSTTTAIISAGTVSAGGPVTINVNSGTLAPGNSYPLLACGGSVPPVSLGILNGFIGTLSTNGSTIQLNITATAYKWTGNNNNGWDLTTPNNWLQNGGPVIFANGGPALFDDTASSNTDIIITGSLLPTSVTFNNVNSNYSITSSAGNGIAGSAALIKGGSGTVTLSGGANTYTGVTTVSGGTLSVGVLDNSGSASDIGAAGSSAANLVLNGGTLQYTGAGASINRLFTIGTAGGTIEASGAAALSLTNTSSLGYSGNGPRGLTLTGTTTDANTLAAPLVNNGGATTLTKSGTGTWVLSGANTYSGATTIAGGTLQIGAGGASGALGTGGIVNNAILDFNRTSSLTVSSVISGTGSVINDGSGTVILTANNTYSGGTTINAGTLQVGSGGSSGSLNSSSPIVDNGLLIFNTTGSFNYSGNGLISGTGNVIVRGSGGTIKAIGANSYSGWTLIDTNATFFVSEGQTGTLLSSAMTNHGTLRIVSQDTHFSYAGPIVGIGRVQIGVNNNNVDAVSTFTGTNAYTGGTFIGGDALQLGDGVTPGAGAIVGNVVFTNNFTTADDNNRILIFNRPDDFTFSGNIIASFSGSQNNRGTVRQNGSGTLTLTGNNTYAGGTAINAGTVQVGNGGTSGTVGFGNVSDSGVLVFNRSDNVTFTNVISGGGSLVKQGAGILTLTATNTYGGATTVSNGTLIVNADNLTSSTHVYAGTLGGTGVFYGPVTLEAGATLAPGASVGTLTINNDLSIGGNLAMELNKSLSPSNDFVVVTGVLTNTGTGTLTVTKLGPNLAPGDKFTLFSQPLQNGAALTVTGGYVNWTNHLADDGSITALSLLPTPTLSFTQTGTNLQFSWTASGFKLQAQTNSINVGISTNWADYPGGGTSPVTVPIVRTNPTVFFRLVSTP